MPDYSTETLSDHDLSTLAVLMADDPKFAAKLADAIAERLDEKFGRRQGDIFFELEELQKGQKKILNKLEDHDTRFDTLDRSIQDLRERHELHAGDFRKVNKRLDSIDGHLGINTDTRRRA